MSYIEKGRAKTVTKIILWLVVISFVATIFVSWGMQRTGINSTTTIAKTDGETIQLDDLQMYQRFLQFLTTEASVSMEPMEQVSWQMLTYYVGNQVAGEMSVQLMMASDPNSMQYVQALIMNVGEQALAREARRMGFSVGDKEIGAVFAEIFRDENGNFVGEEEMEARLARYDFTSGNQSKLRKMMQRHLLARHCISSLMAPVQPVLTEQAKEVFQARMRTVDFSLVRFESDRYRSEVTVSDAGLRDFFNKHRSEFITLEMLFFDTRLFANSLDITEAEILAYYEENKVDQFSGVPSRDVRRLIVEVPDGAGEDQLEAARQRVQDLLTSLAEPGASFDLIARTAAEDDDISYETIENLEPGSENYTDQRFINAAFSITQVGENPTQPVRTNSGFELLQVTSIESGAVKPLAEVRGQVISALREQRRLDQGRIKADELRARAVDEDWQALANEMGFVTFFPSMAAISGESSIYNLANGGSNAGSINNIQSVFSLEAGQLSNVLNLRDSFAILRVKAKGEALEPMYSQLKPVVQTKYREEQAVQIARDSATEFMNTLSEISTPEEFSAAAEAEGLNAEAATTNLYQEWDPRNVNLYGMDLVRQMMENGEGTITGPVDTDDGAYIAYVTSIADMNEEMYETMSNTFALEVLQRLGNSGSLEQLTTVNALLPLEAQLNQIVEATNFEYDQEIIQAMFGTPQTS